ncbi:MAG: DUF4345 family protein [Deltaproteobacteria bacterium]|nr:DUF4345 family protein [Deltaproteobacteria bacterium]
MAGAWFLGLSAALWFLYGLYCFFSPAALGAGAGVTFTSPTGLTELRAMYGGLQMALGFLAAIGLARPGLRQGAILALGVVTAGLGSTRLLGALIDGGWSAYTAMGLMFEWGSALWAASLLRR